MNRITVLLADNNGPVRTQFKRILERDGIEVIGEAKNGLQAVTMARKLCPEIVLMDLKMPLLNGLEAARQILKNSPAPQILVLTVHADEMYVQAATDAGARGFLIKHTCADIVCQAIRELHKGKTFFSPSIPSYLRI
jgi:DNA-binding NarL/FixJ family response regulator